MAGAAAVTPNSSSKALRNSLSSRTVMFLKTSRSSVVFGVAMALGPPVAQSFGRGVGGELFGGRFALGGFRLGGGRFGFGGGSLGLGRGSLSRRSLLSLSGRSLSLSGRSLNLSGRSL